MGMKMVSLLRGCSEKRVNVCSLSLLELSARSQFSMLLKKHFVKVPDLNEDTK